MKGNMDEKTSIDPRAPLRLGIDGEALRRPLSGVGQYVFRLCVELDQLLPGDAQIFVYSRLSAERLALPSPRWKLRREPHAALRKLPSFLWLKTRGARMCLEDGIDVFWAGRTLHPRLPDSVCTVSTVHDLNHLLVPGTMEWPTRLSHRLWFHGDLQRADRVLTNSHGTAERLRSMLGIAADAVMSPGLNDRYQEVPEPNEGKAHSLLRALGVVPPYLLSVATLEPRKNVRAVLQAFLALKRAGELPHHRLVLVGSRGWRNRALEEELIRAGSEGVAVAGYVADELMPALYRGADALVCASMYEGFGMPVLEARACGTPVVVSDVPELREAGGAQAVVVAPTAGGVRDGILRVLKAPPVPEQGLARAHSWRRNAQRLAEMLQSRTSLRHMRNVPAVAALMESR